MPTTNRSFVETPTGRIAWREHGSPQAPAALFVHGVFLSGDLWNGVAERVCGARRCLAPDLLAHGHTEERDGVDLSFAGQAAMLASFLDALALDRVDVVANDSGGGIAQIFAARHPERVASITLTNCDTHDGWPPPAFRPTVDLALSGAMGGLLQTFAADPGTARDAFAIGLEHPEKVSDDQLRDFFAPLVRSGARVAALERFFREMDCAQTVAVESGLRALQAPALIVWGGADVFFERQWAYCCAIRCRTSGASSSSRAGVSSSRSTAPRISRASFSRTGAERPTRSTRCESSLPSRFALPCVRQGARSARRARAPRAIPDGRGTRWGSARHAPARGAGRAGFPR